MNIDISQIPLIFRVLTFTFHIVVIGGVFLEYAKNEACKQDVKVTASLNDIDNERYKYLFSGDYVFKIRVPELELVDVDEIAVKFPGVRGPVYSAFYSYSYDSFFLSLRNNVAEVNRKNSKLTPRSWDEIFNMIKQKFGLKSFEAHFCCATAYKENPYTFAYVDDDRKAYVCRMVPEDIRQTKERSKCTTIDDLIPNPNGIHNDQLQDATCEALSIHRVDNEDFTYQFLLADKQRLRLWHDRNLVASKTLSELFECSYTWMYILISLIVMAAILILMGTGLVCFKVRRSAVVQSSGLTLNTTSSKTQKKFFKK